MMPWGFTAIKINWDGVIPDRCPICHTDRIASHPYNPPHYWCTHPFHDTIAATVNEQNTSKPI